MENIKGLIDFYLTTEHVFNYDLALEKLVSHTNTENYMAIINYIITHESQPTELDLSLYIADIAKKEYTDLIPVIQEKLAVFEDPDAIEELEEALRKMDS